MNNNKEILNNIEEIKNEINEIWNKVTVKDNETITDYWNDSISVEYLKKIKEVDIVINKIQDNLDLLKDCWSNKLEKE